VLNIESPLLAAEWSVMTSGEAPGVFFVSKQRRKPLPASTAARVLTVEDDPIVRADLRLILEDAGFDVCPDARDGIEAVELARAHRPDLILIDLGLPRIDGVEATRRILSERDVPIVALTGHRAGGLVERAIEAGAVAHVLKPFHEAQLVGTIAGALADRVLRDEANADAEREDRRSMILIESMVRGGYSEQAIAKAVRDRYAGDDDFGTPIARSSWIRAIFKR
jgi:two-component system, response regulator PdtaR